MKNKHFRLKLTLVGNTVLELDIGDIVGFQLREKGLHDGGGSVEEVIVGDCEVEVRDIILEFLNVLLRGSLGFSKSGQHCRCSGV